MEFLDLSGNLFNQSIGLAVHNILCRDCIGDASGISNAPLLRLLDLSSNQVDCSSVVRRYFALFLLPISPPPLFLCVGLLMVLLLDSKLHTNNFSSTATFRQRCSTLTVLLFSTSPTTI